MLKSWDTGAVVGFYTGELCCVSGRSLGWRVVRRLWQVLKENWELISLEGNVWTLWPVSADFGVNSKDEYSHMCLEDELTLIACQEVDFNSLLSGRGMGVHFQRKRKEKRT